MGTPTYEGKIISKKISLENGCFIMNYNDFSCPLCKQKLEFHGELFKCSCGNTYNLLDDIPDFWVDNGKTRGMDAYFDNVPEQYESVNYLSRIYQFFGGLATQPEDLMVPIINQGIQDGLNSILKPQHQSILDLACGTGMYTRSLSREASHVWAVDLSMEMLKQAKLNLEEENLENVTLARADAFKLPFSDGQFNGVSCIGAMQLFSDIGATLAEIRRVIKDCGTLAVMTYVKEGVWKEPEHQEYLEKLDIHFFEWRRLKIFSNKMDLKTFATGSMDP
jgi:ubiquinone/menaquinone biosynthesis C-methylase UbiE